MKGIIQKDIAQTAAQEEVKQANVASIWAPAGVLSLEQ
jgi:hypothetical protein